MKKLISVRLRKGLDEDLIGIEIDDKELPDLLRNGLRLMLGIRTMKQVQVVERPIMPIDKSEEK